MILRVSEDMEAWIVGLSSTDPIIIHNTATLIYTCIQDYSPTAVASPSHTRLLEVILRNLNHVELSIHNTLLDILLILFTQQPALVKPWMSLPRCTHSILVLVQHYTQTTEAQTVQKLVSILRLCCLHENKLCMIIRLESGLSILLSSLCCRSFSQERALLRQLCDLASLVLKAQSAHHGSITVQCLPHVSAVFQLWKSQQPHTRLSLSLLLLLYQCCQHPRICTKCLMIGSIDIIQQRLTNRQNNTSTISVMLQMIHTLYLECTENQLTSHSLNLLPAIPALHTHLIEPLVKKTLMKLLWCIHKHWDSKTDKDETYMQMYDLNALIRPITHEAEQRREDVQTHVLLHNNTTTNATEDSKESLSSVSPSFSLVSYCPELWDPAHSSTHATRLVHHQQLSNNQTTHSLTALTQTTPTMVKHKTMQWVKQTNSFTGKDTDDVIEDTVIPGCISPGHEPMDVTKPGVMVNRIVEEIHTIIKRVQNKVSVAPSEHQQQSMPIFPQIVYDRVNPVVLSPPHGSSPSLSFSSDFESGNLRRVIRRSAVEYDLLFSPDVGVSRHTQWFFFCVSRTTRACQYRFNLINFEKDSSSFNVGMKPVWLSTKDAAQTGRGWRRCETAENIGYFHNVHQRIKHTRQQKKQLPAQLSSISTTSTAAEESDTDEEGEDEEENGEGSEDESRPTSAVPLTPTQKQKDTNKRQQSQPQRRDTQSRQAHGSNPHTHSNKRNKATPLNNSSFSQSPPVSVSASCCYFTLTFTLSFLHADDTVYLAYCYPFTYSFLRTCLDHVSFSPYYHSSCLYRQPLCKTKSGNLCELLTITDFTAEPDIILTRPVLVFTARVHPGESNASWIMKGLIEFLLSSHPVAEQLRSHTVIKLVPMLNPDGVIEGNYRCSLSGVDLNRQWGNPDLINHPTIYHTKQLLSGLSQQRRLLLYVDLHGHSRMKNVCLYGCEERKRQDTHTDSSGPPLWSVRLFPSLLSHHLPSFSLSQCSFAVQPSKAGTARVVIWRELKLTDCFTLEASFAGMRSTPDSEKESRHFNTEDWEYMGQALAISALELVRNREPTMGDKQTTQQKHIDIQAACTPCALPPSLSASVVCPSSSPPPPPPRCLPVLCEPFSAPPSVKSSPAHQTKSFLPLPEMKLTKAEMEKAKPAMRALQTTNAVKVSPAEALPLAALKQRSNAGLSLCSTPPSATHNLLRPLRTVAKSLHAAAPSPSAISVAGTSAAHLLQSRPRAKTWNDKKQLKKSLLQSNANHLF